MIQIEGNLNLSILNLFVWMSISIKKKKKIEYYTNYKYSNNGGGNNLLMEVPQCHLSWC